MVLTYLFEGRKALYVNYSLQGPQPIALQSYHRFCDFICTQDKNLYIFATCYFFINIVENKLSNEHVNHVPI